MDDDDGKEEQHGVQGDDEEVDDEQDDGEDDALPIAWLVAVDTRIVGYNHNEEEHRQET
jgi:hypothetical protein